MNFHHHYHHLYIIIKKKTKTYQLICEKDTAKSIVRERQDKKYPRQVNFKTIDIRQTLHFINFFVAFLGFCLLILMYCFPTINRYDGFILTRRVRPPSAPNCHDGASVAWDQWFHMISIQNRKYNHSRRILKDRELKWKLGGTPKGIETNALLLVPSEVHCK